MSVRAFQYYSILATNTPQPLVGTTLSAAVSVPKQYQGAPAIMLTVAVVDSSAFVQGDDAAFLSAAGMKATTVNVAAIPDATHVTVQGIIFSYAIGDFLSVAMQTNSPYIQGLDGNVGPLYIGSQYNFNPATGYRLIAKMQRVAAGTQPYDFSTVRPGFADTEPANNYWISGTAGDQYLPSFGVV